MVAAATYRQREVEDEDEEAVHDESSAEWAGGASGGRRVGDPSHTQTCRSPPASRPAEPALPALGATPPAARERWRDREEAGLVVGGWVVLVWHGSGSLDRSVCLPLCGAEVAWRSRAFYRPRPGRSAALRGAVPAACSAGAVQCRGGQLPNQSQVAWPWTEWAAACACGSRFRHVSPSTTIIYI